MKKKLKKWEKLFVYGSIIFIIGCIFFYGGRLIYFYKLEHPNKDKNDKTFITAIFNNNKTVVINDGLYKINDTDYYFKGININNYVYYSGRLWQIISIDKNSIKLITTDNQTSLVWGINNEYSSSYINKWLNGIDNQEGLFLNSLNNYTHLLNKSSYCIDTISLEKLTCQNKYESYVGLPTIKEYIQAGGENSYLNNNTYWWTGNTSSDNHVWYVFNEGGISDNSSNEITYHSYGVRPVINVKKDAIAYSGNGTLDNPFMLDSNDNIIINDKSIGSYLKYSDQIFKIMEKNDNYVKIVMANPLKINDEDYKIIYNKSNSQYNANNNIYKYLNNTFYKTLDKTALKKCKFNVGSYGQVSSYDYQNTYTKKIDAYVGIQSIGEFFTNEYDNTWLSNNIDNFKLTSYTSFKNGTIFADDIKSSNYIRPVICIDNNIAIGEGKGTLNDPFMLEDLNESDN